jgi:hypothetical protein
MEPGSQNSSGVRVPVRNWSKAERDLFSLMQQVKSKFRSNEVWKEVLRLMNKEASARGIKMREYTKSNLQTLYYNETKRRQNEAIEEPNQDTVEEANKDQTIEEGVAEDDVIEDNIKSQPQRAGMSWLDIVKYR